MSGMMSETPSRARLAIIGHVVHLVNRDYEAMARDYYGDKPHPQPEPEPKPKSELKPEHESECILKMNLNLNLNS